MWEIFLSSVLCLNSVYIAGAANLVKLQWDSTGHRSTLHSSVNLLGSHRLQLLAHQLSSILEDNGVHPVQIVKIGVDVSPINIGAHTKGQRNW